MRCSPAAPMSVQFHVMLLLVLVFLWDPSPSFGDTIGVAAASDAIGPLATSLVSRVVPTKALDEKVLHFKFIPAYFAFKEDQETGGGERKFSDMSGGGGALNMVYGFSPHWGIAVLGSYFSGDGQRGFNRNPSTPTPIRQIVGSLKTSGVAASAGVIYDPFSDPEGFRLPIYLGFTYFNAKEISNGVLAGAGQLEHVQKFNTVGVQFSIAPQFDTDVFGLFDTKIFRVIPFVGVVALSNGGSDTCTAQGSGASCGTLAKPSNSPHPVGGLEVAYKPWDLSFTYIPSPLTTGASLYTLSYTRSFSFK